MLPLLLGATEIAGDQVTVWANEQLHPRARTASRNFFIDLNCLNEFGLKLPIKSRKKNGQNDMSD
jgi:hypothetical protein